MIIFFFGWSIFKTLSIKIYFGSDASERFNFFIIFPSSRSTLKGNLPRNVYTCMHAQADAVLVSMQKHKMGRDTALNPSSLFCSSSNHHVTWSWWSIALIKPSFPFPLWKIEFCLRDPFSALQGLLRAWEVSSVCFDLSELLTWHETPQSFTLSSPATFPSHL